MLNFPDVFSQDFPMAYVRLRKSMNLSKYDSLLLNQFSYIVNLCSNIDSDRLVQALHENFLSMRIRDSNFESVDYFGIFFCFAPSAFSSTFLRTEPIRYSFQ